MNKKKANRKIKAAGVILLSLALIVTGVFAAGGTKLWRNDEASYAADEVAEETEKKVNSTFPELGAPAASSKGMTKDETVYMIMDADGAEKELIVSESISNPKKKDRIKDYSKLTDIENTSGDEEFAQDGTSLIWAADGNDIKYTGKTEEDLPVNCEVNYYLNGKNVSADEIAGKSGNVEIHFDYYVTARDRVKSNGKGFDLAHPYIMASGVMLSEDHFTDITVNSGKTSSEGGNTICLGIAFPGMRENLDLSKDVLDLPESVVIKAKTDKFEIDGTYTVALTGLFGDIDTDTDEITDKLDELESAFGKLKSASSKLVKGSKALSKGTGTLSSGTSALSDGTSALKKKSNTLAGGVSKLYKGSKNLSSGTSQIKEGASQAVDGAKELSDGLTQISENSTALNGATKQIENTVFKSATSQLQAALVQGGFPAEQAASFTLTPETYTAVLAKLKQAAPQAASAFDEIQTSLDAIEQYVQSVAAYTAGVDKAAQGSTDFYDKLGALSEGASQVDEGASQVETGLSQLAESMPALKKGIKKLDNGASQVDGGAAQLKSGASKLSKGISKFDKDGIRKLVSSLDTDEISDMLARFDAVAKASDEKHFVDGTKSKMAGESRIIFKTAKIEA